MERLGGALAEALTATTGRPVAEPLYAMLGFDPATGSVVPGGGLAATPMARLRDRTSRVLLASGITEAMRNGRSRRPGTPPIRSRSRDH